MQVMRVVEVRLDFEDNFWIFENLRDYLGILTKYFSLLPWFYRLI